MQLIAEFLKWLYRQIGTPLLIISPILGALAWFTTSLPTINDGLEQLQAKVVELRLALVTAMPQVEPVWNAARYWFPVDLALLLAGILLVLQGVSAIVRLIKALIPFWN